MSKIPKYSTTTTIDNPFSGFSTLSSTTPTTGINNTAIGYDNVIYNTQPYPRNIFAGIEEIMGIDILTEEQISFLDELYNTGNESDMTIAKEMFMTILREYETTKKEEKITKEMD